MCLDYDSMRMDVNSEWLQILWSMNVLLSALLANAEEIN